VAIRARYAASVSPRDTTPDAAAVQVAVYRRMSPERKIELGIRMSEEARAITLGAIRRRHPEYDDQQARYALFRLLWGDELFKRAWPLAPLLQP
jgi:hypothetical protein